MDGIKKTTSPTSHGNATAPSHAETMARIHEGMKRLGDLPIFSASINKIRNISSDPDSDAMAVAKEILKDANLSAKLLRLGNSAYYNRGVGKISVVSRSVVLLGFKTVRSLTLTLKLIESFQSANPSVDMGKMLVRSFLAAGFVRDMADKCGIKDIEESYVCALLHNLGEIAVTYVMPEEHQRINNLIKDEKMTKAGAENLVLGTSIYAISQDLAKAWEFPATVISSMAPPPEKISGGIKDRSMFNRSLAALSHTLLDNLYTDSEDSERFTGAMEMISKVTGLNDSMVENFLSESFRQSCSLATEYGLDKKLLKPQLGNSEGTTRNKWARQFSYYASLDEDGTPLQQDTPSKVAVSTRETVPASSVPVPATRGNSPDSGLSPADHSAALGRQPGNTAPQRQDSVMPAITQEMLDSASPQAADLSAPTSHDPQIQLQIIQEITSLISRSARLSEVFVKVLDGLHRGAGFDRTLLCLVTQDRKSYVGRMSAGAQGEALKQYFSFPINPGKDAFSRLIVEGGEISVDDAASETWRQQLPQNFVQQTRARSFLAAGMRFQDRAVGFFYVDRAVTGRPITDDDQRNMLQFINQARLALRLCS